MTASITHFQLLSRMPCIILTCSNPNNSTSFRNLKPSSVFNFKINQYFIILYIDCRPRKTSLKVMTYNCKRIIIISNKKEDRKNRQSRQTVYATCGSHNSVRKKTDQVQWNNKFHSTTENTFSYRTFVTFVKCFY